MVGRCEECGHLGAVPLALLLRRFDIATPQAEVRRSIVCSSCNSRNVDVRSMRLCDPGCPRQRG